jgi:hypothetical protein
MTGGGRNTGNDKSQIANIKYQISNGTLSTVCASVCCWVPILYALEHNWDECVCVDGRLWRHDEPTAERNSVTEERALVEGGQGDLGEVIVDDQLTLGERGRWIGGDR